MLGLQPNSIAKALTKRKIKAGAEWVEQDLKLDAANDGRDALSKAIYSRLFDYLIRKINVAFLAGGQPVDEKSAVIVGIVDIFGFEVFEVNSLEQLCINFTNEKLQALFTKTVFEETLKAYKADGIDADDITYVDNKVRPAARAAHGDAPVCVPARWVTGVRITGGRRPPARARTPGGCENAAHLARPRGRAGAH